MATNRKFLTKNGLDAGTLAIDNAGTSGSSLGVSGAFGVTLTATGTTNVTLPTTGTLLTSATLPSITLGTGTTGNYVATVAAATPGAQTGTSGLTITAVAGEGTAATISHADTSSAANLTATARTYVTGLTIDGFGHLTAYTTGTETVIDTNWYPTAFAWTDGTSTGPTGSLTGTGMTAVSYAAIPSASATASGIVTTGAQTFAGAKTFSTAVALPLGSAAVPSLTFNTDADTGIFRVSEGAIGFSTQGVERIRVNSTGDLVTYGPILMGSNTGGTTTWIRKYASGYSTTHTPTLPHRIGQVTFTAPSQHLTISGQLRLNNGGTVGVVDFTIHLRSETLPTKNYVFEKIQTTLTTPADIQLYEDTASGLFVLTYTSPSNIQSVAWDISVSERGDYRYWQQVSATTVQDLTGLTLRAPTTVTKTFSSALVGNLTGNASSATTLQTARNINGVSFNGSADITVAAAAGTLSGTTLNAAVVSSSLTSVGTLGSLSVTGTASAADPTLSTHLATKNYVDTQVVSASGGLTVTVVAGTTQTAVSGVMYVMTATSGVSTLTLPASPTAGNTVAVSNFTGRTDLVIARNGSNIMEIADNMTVDSTKVTVTLRFVNASIGWIIV